MNISITMNEQDIKEAVDAWLLTKGLRATGKPAVHHDPGSVDPREHPSSSIVVQAEPIAPIGGGPT